MAKLPEVVKTAIDKCTLASVATADNHEMPNVVYVSYLKYQDDETVILANNKFVKTSNNLENNSQIAFVVLDSDTKKSYQIKGKARTLTNGEIYESVVKWVHEKKPDVTPKAAVCIQVEEVYCGSERLA